MIGKPPANDVFVQVGRRDLQSDSHDVDMTEATWLYFQGVAHDYCVEPKNSGVGLP